MKKNRPKSNELAAAMPQTATAEEIATAWHEAGHAVMAISLGRPIEKVTISPAQIQTGGSRLGACKIQKGRSKASNDFLEDEVLILLAGMVAESRVTGRYCPQGASMDMHAVERLLATRATSESHQRRLVRRMLDKTAYTLEEPAHAMAIELVANELLGKITISGRSVRHLFELATQRTRDNS